ncbi:MAG: ATP-dependent Clp protease proteolytic subunit, partial [Bdellovibrionaceae bacterium]|nr:ATP-dependent Clp protease proteolytic subunit [Pseudobdellovibrionaceae bacterium]
MYIVVLSLFIFISQQSSALDELALDQEASLAFIDPLTQQKQIHFLKNFESLRKDGTSDVDFFKSSLKTLELAPSEELHLYLRSGGGEIAVGLNIYSFLLWLQQKGVTVVTHVEDHCDSICIPVFASGSKRWAKSSSTFIIHPPSYPFITDKQEQAAAEAQARSHYLKAITTASPSFAEQITKNKWMENQPTELTAQEIFLLSPDFLKIQEASLTTGNCSRQEVQVNYTNTVDYEIACQALDAIYKLVSQEL